MKSLRALWSRLADFQQKLSVKICLSALALLVVIGLLGTTWVEASRANSRFIGIVEILQDVNSLEQDAIVVRLLEKGELEYQGQVFGNDQYTEYIGTLFDEDSGRLIDAAMVSALLISKDIPSWIPSMLIDSPSIAFWIGIGLLVWLMLVIYSEITLQVTAGILGTGVACGLVWVFSILGITLDPMPWILAVSGIGILVITFLLLIRVALLVLGFVASPGAGSSRHGTPRRLVQICAVAHVLIRESVRQKISLAFIILLLVMLPLIPIWIDPSEPLRYQIQNFLSDSMSLVYVLAACMTLILGCATVSFEIRDRQIWQLITKPMGKLEYLLGKWVGLLVLNMILLSIGGLSIFSFTEYLRNRPSADPMDAMVVADEVLTARVGILPVFSSLSNEAVRDRVDNEIDNNAILKDEIASGERRMNDVRRQLARQVRREHLDQQRSIPPTTLEDGAELDVPTYSFAGLGSAKSSGGNLTLRYEFHIGRSESTDHYPVIFNFPDIGQQIEQIYVPAQWHSVLVPSSWVNEDGELKVQILNGGFSQSPSETTLMFFANGATLFFDPDGFEVMWQASTFETNFLRAMLINLIKLSFLGMLGIVAATFLSFPIAVMLAFTVFAGGSLAPFISMSVGEFRLDYEAIFPVRAAQWLIIIIAQSAEWLLRPFGEASPNSRVIEGRLVPWGGVIRDFLQLGILWCGIVLMVGWAVFRRRELATYSGNG